MTTYEAMTERRSIRRFDGARPIPDDILMRAADVARLAPCGGNGQSLKFCIVKEPALVKGVFELSAWGMHLKDGSGRPGAGQEPVAWVLILNDNAVKEKASPMDVGAACENIMIYCQSEGIASCWLENIKRREIAQLLNLPDETPVVSSVALGYPAMRAAAVELPDSGATPYFWGGEGLLYVPKRALKDVVIVK